MSDKITFSQLVGELAEQTDSSQALSHDFVSALADLIVNNAMESGKASITNFGSFTVVDIAARNGVNPQTGESIIIPAHQRLSFSPYKALENIVNAPFSSLEATIIEESAPKSAAVATESKPKSVPPKETTKEEGPKELLVENTEQPEEKEKKPEIPVFKRPGKQVEKAGNVQNILLIIVVLLMTVVALWFFVFRDTSAPGIAEQTPPPLEIPADPTPNPPPAADQTATDSDTPDEETLLSGEPSPEETTNTTEASKVQSDYVVSSGEWMYDIARNNYNQPAFWPLIFEANFSSSQDPDLIIPGKALKLPEIQNAQNPSENDRARLASAHRMVSEAYANAGKTEQAENYARMAALFSN